MPSSSWVDEPPDSPEKSTKISNQNAVNHTLGTDSDEFQPINIISTKKGEPGVVISSWILTTDQVKLKYQNTHYSVQTTKYINNKLSIWCR